MKVEDIRFHKNVMNLNSYSSSRHVRKKNIKFLVPLSIVQPFVNESV